MKKNINSLLIIILLLSAGMPALALDTEHVLGLGYGLPYGGKVGINNVLLKGGSRNDETIEDISIGLGVNWRLKKGFNFDADIFYRHYDDIEGYEGNRD